MTASLPFLLTAIGASGAAFYFTRNAWPGGAIRMRNTAAMIWALGVSGILWAILPDGWRLGAGWAASAMLLQVSHALTRPGQWVMPRAVIVCALVSGAALWLDG
ncbi:MAG: hypothetical protein AB7G39_17950 [Alphaproteobacteria bacterium]